ncbi:MgtC/SapB family protein [Clostridium aminobutyricum]|uniref:MgtC/SapB family protein n=1 Tax=Clostridium aminobutyricum TaxID=33953 RepID=A0A939D7M7_CLOAM|nr:MgtC/SapB family protein [Clostridium aminobutyricum]MBN7772939.1 MgtC/SapB family protein [Clostridium aminobutyricum]
MPSSFYDITSLSLYDVNIASIFTRLLLAVILGGIIGLERGAANHPAGFRTHILVCVGSTLAMLTDQYIFQFLTPIADPARLGAQVITGVGFLGVGTIFVTGRHRIKGLTTAAGLWASACLGLAIGIGFYSGAIIAGILIFVSLALFPKVENHFLKHSRFLNLYVEVDSIASFKAFVAQVKQQGYQVFDAHISSSDPILRSGIAFYIFMKTPKDIDHNDIVEEFYTYQGVFIIDEV